MMGDETIKDNERIDISDPIEPLYSTWDKFCFFIGGLGLLVTGMPFVLFAIIIQTIGILIVFITTGHLIHYP